MDPLGNLSQQIAAYKRTPGRGAADFGRELLPPLIWIGEVGLLRLEDRVLRVSFEHRSATVVTGLTLAMVSLEHGPIDDTVLLFDDVAPERVSSVAGVNIRGDEQVIASTEDPDPEKRWTWYMARPRSLRMLRGAVFTYASQWRAAGRSLESVACFFHEDAREDAPAP